MKKIIILITIALSLSGCVAAIPAAFVIGATAGGALVYDKRNVKTMLQDHNSEAYAQNWIDADPELKGKSHIEVKVFNHVALLAGQASTPELRARASQIVANTKNISRIYNEITIQKPTSLERRTDDSWITAKVKSKMLERKGLHSTEIDVITEDGVVYLMGMISKPQSDLAADVARKINGVKKVEKVFQYT